MRVCNAELETFLCYSCFGFDMEREIEREKGREREKERRREKKRVVYKRYAIN